ncbi:hypothetical protein K435DRAFT_854458 [Dendrothele bispora CBS 962.96]|uniref:Uncharacterized protein n=1 Tax=Dendrothele bispora (strain CBS 962.96) TaxID=1314807 RepID=A0A4S8MDM4_DENBC|nr:hypothetical protein K435DRAFT_854458 [Dendrothele bispora CBS 962.96]
MLWPVLLLLTQSSVCSSGCGHPLTKQKLNPLNLHLDLRFNDCSKNLDRSMESGPRTDLGSTKLNRNDYNNLHLQVDGEVHNLMTANYALNQVIATARKDLQLVLNVAVRSIRGNLTCVEVEIINHARVLGSAMSAAHYSILHDNLTIIQDQFKAVGMAYDSLTTFLNQSFNSSRAVIGFVNEQDGIMTQILRAPIPIASTPLPSSFTSPAVLAGARVGFSIPHQLTPFNGPPTRLTHALPPKPSSSRNLTRHYHCKMKK